MKNLYQLLALIYSSCLFSCGTGQKNRSGDISYTLEIVDSLQIDYLGGLQLYAVHEDKGLFLFSEFRPNKLLLTDRQGNILSTFDQPGDSPESYGNTACAAVFMEDQIAILGPGKLVLYDTSFNFIKSLKKPYAGKGMIYSGYDHLQVGETDDKNTLIAFTGGPQTEAAPNQEAFYNHFNTFDEIDLNSGDFIPHTPLHPESRYTQGEAFNFIRPLFQVRGNYIHFAFETDTVLYRYDISDPEGNFITDGISFDRFILNPGYPMGGNEDYDKPKPQAGSIMGYFKLDDKDLIIYRSGYPLQDRPSLNLTREERKMETSRLNPTKFLLREDDGNFSKPALHPKRFSMVRTDSKNRLWARQEIEELEEEPNVVTFYQVELVKEN